MKAEDSKGDFYVPEGESRHVRFVSDWYHFRGGRLYCLVEVAELSTESSLLLRQYGADTLLISLLSVEPDPSDWVRVSRYEGGGWSVEKNPDSIDDLADAM